MSWGSPVCEMLTTRPCGAKLFGCTYPEVASSITSVGQILGVKLVSDQIRHKGRQHPPRERPGHSRPNPQAWAVNLRQVRSCAQHKVCQDYGEGEAEKTLTTVLSICCLCSLQPWVRIWVMSDLHVVGSPLDCLFQVQLPFGARGCPFHGIFSMSKKLAGSFLYHVGVHDLVWLWLHTSHR